MEQGIGSRVSSPPTAPTHPLQPTLVSPVVGQSWHHAVTISFPRWAPGNGGAAGQHRDRSGASHARPQSVTHCNPNQFCPELWGLLPLLSLPSSQVFAETTVPRSNSSQTQLCKISDPPSLPCVSKQNCPPAMPRPPSKTPKSGPSSSHRLPSSFSSSSSISPLLSKPASHSLHPGSPPRLIFTSSLSHLSALLSQFYPRHFLSHAISLCPRFCLPWGRGQLVGDGVCPICFTRMGTSPQGQGPCCLFTLNLPGHSTTGLVVAHKED